MKRLYKSRKDRVIAGVCGGVGEYFNLDPVLIRIIWVLFAVMGGSGILAYIIGMIIIPESPEATEPDPVEPAEPESPPATTRESRSTSQTVWGVLLIAVGLIVLFDQFHIFRFFSHEFWHVSWSVIFPLFIILIGGLILFRRDEDASKQTRSTYSTEEQGEQGPKSTQFGNTIVRPKHDRKLAGVCSGLGYYLKFDPTIVRLLWVIGTFATGGVAVLIYIILAIVLPEGDVSDFESTDTGNSGI